MYFSDVLIELRENLKYTTKVQKEQYGIVEQIIAAKWLMTAGLTFIFRDVLGLSRFGFFLTGGFITFLGGYFWVHNQGWLFSGLVFLSGIVLLSVAIKGDKANKK
jgi:hypothetical protein